MRLIQNFHFDPKEPLPLLATEHSLGLDIRCVRRSLDRLKAFHGEHVVPASPYVERNFDNHQTWRAVLEGA